jgi:hypothetical protein
MTTNGNCPEAKRFIEALYSRYFADHDGYVELRMISANVLEKWLRKGQLEEQDWDEITKWNETHHIYLGVNPRPLSKEKKKNDIQDIVCLWADVDGKDFEDGGKEAALRSVEAFPLKPTIIVDSGHGYHLYWVLEKPMLGVKDDRLAVFKQVLAGVVKALGGDQSKIDHVACLRLPGTMNRKDEEEPVPCRIVSITDRTYQVKDFIEYRDETYREPKPMSKEEWKFGTKEKIVRSDSAEHAAEDVERLEIKSSVKRHILTGAPRTEAGVDHTRSGRDWLIITSLIFSDYNYDTIRSIFLNPFLKCSNRIFEKGEAELRHDVERAVEAVIARRGTGSPQAEAILQIRAMKITPEEKRQDINRYIIEDLLTGPSPAGRGFKEIGSGTIYYFDNVAKMPWDVGKKKDEGPDFYYFIRDRYDISRKDFDEIRDAVATEIEKGQPEVRVHRVAYWDEEKGVLYLSNHNNQILRLDGSNIRLLDNGEEGVFFHFDPRLTPFQFDEKKIAEAVNYFETYDPEKVFSWGKISEGIVFGLRLDRFYEQSLLNEYLVARANFAPPDSENPVDEDQQRLLLLLYFYSLFFESALKDKPIACFLGLMASGKSTTATAIGKILFGDSFIGKNLPNDVKDLKVVVGRNYYYEIDNLDSVVTRNMCDILAATATGAGSEDRTLFTNEATTVTEPHCFLVITSREPKFKRPDVVDRLLIFRMKKIDEPVSGRWLFRTLLERREDIMAEVISNLNSIVFMLNQSREVEKAQGPNYQPPKNIFRIADWEDFAKKICSLWPRVLLQLALEAMAAEKAGMTIDEDYVFQIIHYIVQDEGGELRELSAAQLYSRMRHAAEFMELEDFQRRYPSAMSVATHVPHIAEAMAARLYVDICQSRKPGHPMLYTFLRSDQEPVRFPSPYAETLGLVPGTEYGPEEVLEKVLKLDPKAAVSKEDLIRAFGVRKKGRARANLG